MKQKIFSITIVFIMALAGWGGLTPVKAAGPAPEKSAINSSEYLILFTIPHLQPADAPAGISVKEAKHYASLIIERQFEQIRPQLQRYIQAGQLSGLSVQPDRAGATVQVNDLSILKDLERLPGVQGIYLSTKSVECSGWVANDLTQALANGANQVPLGGQRTEALAATDPAINVYHHAGGTSWGWVDIMTTPDTPVSMRILRGGAAVGAGTGNSYDDGSYEFWSSSDSCSSLSEWEIHDGDTVEVTAHGSTVSTVVTPLEAWMDPGSNQVAGTTDPNRQVKIALESALSDPCNWNTTNQTVSSNAAGAFTKTFSDFNRRAESTIWVLDANGNSTYANFHAYDIETGVGWSEFDIHWKAGENVTTTLTRGGKAIYTWNWSTDPGWDYYYFDLPSSDTVQPGDVIAVSSSISSMSYTVVPLTLSVDLAGDKITGSSGAKRLVRASLYHAWQASCSAYACYSTNTNSSGTYTISAPVGVGDEVDVATYDGEGNSQYGGFAITAYLEADPAWNEVGIYNWPGADPLTVTLMDSANVVKQTVTGITPSEDYNNFWVYIDSANIDPGDKIDVTDGTYTVDMTVSSLASRLNTNAAKLTGNSSNGHLMADLYDFRRDQSELQEYCSETQVTKGSFNLGFSGAQIGPQDTADVYLAGADGSFTYVNALAFTVYIYRDYGDVSGRTEVGGSSVTVTAKRNGVTLDSQTTTSDSGGYFYSSLAVGGVFQTGDVVQVTTNENNSATLTIPNLAINIDSANQRVYGVAPAGEPLRLWLELESAYNNFDSDGWLTTVDATGHFTSSTAGRLVHQCQAVVPGSLCTAVGLNYDFPGKEHQITASNSNEIDVLADAFEPDNTFDTASTYTAVQQHTFDTDDDEDWVSFNVPQADVDAGVAYRIQTFKLGIGMDTNLELYASDGVTLLEENDDVSSDNWASLIVWKPSSAGKYYVRALPYNENFTHYCGAFYSLSILPVRSEIFLPAVVR